MTFEEFCKHVKLPSELENEFKEFILDGDLLNEESFDVDEFAEEQLQNEYNEFVNDCHPELDKDDNEEDD